MNTGVLIFSESCIHVITSFRTRCEYRHTYIHVYEKGKKLRHRFSRPSKRNNNKIQKKLTDETHQVSWRRCIWRARAKRGRRTCRSRDARRPETKTTRSNSSHRPIASVSDWPTVEVMPRFDTPAASQNSASAP